MTDADRPLHVWCLLRDQHDHVRPVEAHLGSAARFTYDERWDPGVMTARLPDLVLCVNEFQHEVAVCIDSARAARVPTLVLQDGILEWRCQYENPLFGAGGGAPQHQPVLSDKIACIGSQSARHIVLWGNSGKVEVTGMPRLDVLNTISVPPRREPGRRILVMTAKKPWFDERQKEMTLRSLLDLKAHLALIPGVEVTWRLTKNVAEMIGVENRLSQLGSVDLATAIGSADAVISTLSTAVVEAMLLDRPVAALDYHNTPRFLNTAWTISAKEHLGAVLPELLAPLRRKMGVQREYLVDALWSDGPAAGRVAELVAAMATAGRSARESGRELALPKRMLESSVAFPESPPPDLAALYPESAVFREDDPVHLRVRLARAEARIRSMHAEKSWRRTASRAYAACRKVFTPGNQGRVQ